jgi:lysophospholipase L1-like esterase
LKTPNFLSSFALLIIFGFLVSCSKKNMSNNTPSPDPTSKTYLALGDSYTIGQSVTATERFPNQTTALLRAQNIKIADPVIVATTGWTTRDLINALNANPQPNTFDVVSLLIGVNNQYQRKSLEEYKTEFTLLVNRAIQYAGNKPTHVFVLSIPDYSVTPFASGSDKARIAGEIDQFNEANKAISLQLGVKYLDVTPISREPNQSLIAGDGLHPSGKQYKRWAELLAPIMKTVLNP